jgi:hypothetical protein
MTLRSMCLCETEKNKLIWNVYLLLSRAEFCVLLDCDNYHQDFVVHNLEMNDYEIKLKKVWAH